MKIFRFVYNDQLSLELASLKNADKKNDTIVFIESMHEYTFVKHHKKKIVFLIAAMRHFADNLQELGFKVLYLKLDRLESYMTITEELNHLAQQNHPTKIVVTEPSDYRQLLELQKASMNGLFKLEILEDHRFLASKNEFYDWAQGKKELRMEFFYRLMRKKYRILVDDRGEPLGGKWNYDSENRKFPHHHKVFPQTYQAPSSSILKEVMTLVEQNFPDHFGQIKPFFFALTRKQALAALNLFLKERLKFFGDFQDAMVQDEPWLYHSHLSFYINSGLLNPLECIHAAQEAYHQNKISINAAEGFIRQILGWREYIRGIYWLKMPEYKKNNFLKAKNSLPDFFWNGQTKMNCLAQCIQETQQNAYAHHIQRLMVLGNFCLLAGIHPDEVNEWYHIVYADAYEWVELPNVTGMILFADGGYLASKPYAASGAYINKMSNYCKKCSYNVEEKTGADACPFNYLYWDFLLRNYDQLNKNPRLTMVYSLLKKMTPEKTNQIQTDTTLFLESLRDDR